MALLEIEDLRVGYGFPVLMGISFQVEEGETAVLFGLNGAGKTTTVATIAGQLKPDSGSIRFAGDEIGGVPATKLVGARHRARPRGASRVPRAQRRRTTCASAHGRGAATPPRSPTRRELVFEYFPRLAQRADQAAGTLSGGEQQMLAIGRALMSNPKLLLIDEASLGLSPALAKIVFQVVKRINDDGVTVVIVEQNVGVLPVRRSRADHGEGHVDLLRRRRRDPQREPARDLSRRRPSDIEPSHHPSGGNHEQELVTTGRIARHRATASPASSSSSSAGTVPRRTTACRRRCRTSCRAGSAGSRS